MRNTWQGPLGSETNDNPTIQQLMEIVSALQEAMTTSRVEQERLMSEARAEQLLKQDQLMVEIDVSQARNEELCKTKEELCMSIQQLDERSTGERGPIVQLRACSKPFSLEIMDDVIPANYITPKITFIGVEDPESHLTVFNAQIIISGGIDVIHCKMFMGTLTGMTLQWFVGLPDGHITSFDQFSELFRELLEKMALN